MLTDVKHYCGAEDNTSELLWPLEPHGSFVYEKKLYV